VAAGRPRRAHWAGPRRWGGEVAGGGGEAEVADDDELIRRGRGGKVAGIDAVWCDRRASNRRRQSERR
jgi:hypothetical protein